MAGPVKSGEVVTVACKMPHGLMIRLFDKVNRPFQGPSGEVKFEEAMEAREGTSLKINGYAEPYASGDPRPLKSSSFAFTDNVPKDLWDEWMKQSGRTMDMVKHNLLWAESSPEAARKRAAELEGSTRNGLEPIRPDLDLPSIMKEAAKAA